MVYQYTCQTCKDSPTCANYELQRSVRENIGQYPEATKAKNFYKDDYLDSEESPEKANIRWNELVHFINLGWFKFSKLVSRELGLADQIDGSPQSIEPKKNRVI